VHLGGEVEEETEAVALLAELLHELHLLDRRGEVAHGGLEDETSSVVKRRSPRSIARRGSRGASPSS